MQDPLRKFVVVPSVALLLVGAHMAIAGAAVAQSTAPPVEQAEVTQSSAPPVQQAAVTQASTPVAQPAGGAAKPSNDTVAVARSFAELATKLEPGDTVYVTRQEGERTRAEVQGFDADLATLFFSADGVSFGLSENELSRLELRYGDSLANGAVIGAVAGSGIFVIAGITCALVDACHATSETFAAAALFGGIGAGIGVAIDSSVKTERLVYVGPQAAARGISWAPVISRTRQGALVVLRF